MARLRVPQSGLQPGFCPVLAALPVLIALIARSEQKGDVTVFQSKRWRAAIARSFYLATPVEVAVQKGA
jgi:hypothetical protein